jgi:hypothetical protein
MDRANLRAAVVAGRDRLDATLARFDDAAMLERVEGEWTRKDVLAHLEAWERRLLTLVTALRAGDPLPPSVETDALNEQFFQANRDRSLDDVRSGERDAYERMLAAIDEATDEELFDGTHFRWTDGEPFASWFRANGDEHYDEHLEQLSRPARQHDSG